ILYPLYVKLIFDIVSKWTSFYEPDDEFKKCLNIDSSIRYLFLSLEQVHGSLLFSRTIIYMSLFKNGISENEIEDILSLDDDVLYDIFEFHAPPIRKLPIALWARIKNDLKEYMVEKEIDDTRVIYWYHRRFIEVANSFYVTKLNSVDRTSIFTNVIDFFNETWKHKPKPYIYNDYLTKKFGVKNGESEEVRDTGMQPTVFFEPDGKIRYNKRKLSELPAFIGNLTANLAINLACDLVFFDLNFLTGLFTHLSLVDIFEHLSNISGVSSYSMSEESRKNMEQLNIFRLCLLQCGVQMKDNPEGLMIHFLSRSLNFYKHLGNFTKIIDQYYDQSPKYYSLVLAHQFMEPPIGELIFQLDKHSAPITHTVIGGDNDRLVLTFSNKISVFDLNELNDLGDIKIPDFDANIKFFAVFLNSLDQNYSILKDIRGGIILCSLNDILVLNFDSSIRFLLNTGKKILSNAVPINEHLIILFYENESFIELYDMKKKEVFEIKSFENKIIHSCCNIKNGLIINLEENGLLYFAVFFENSSFSLFRIIAIQLKIELLKTFQPCGRIADSINFLKVFDPEVPTLLLNFYDTGTLMILNINEILIIASKNIKDFSLTDSGKKSALFITSQKSLVFMKENKIYEIKGNFSNGCLAGNDKVIGIENGTVSIFIIRLTETLELLRIGSIDAHFDKIVFVFPKDTLLLTTSKDSSLKIFSTNMITDLSKLKLDIQKACDEILDLIQINEKYLISKIILTK
ncbi:NACHT and WD repeat domain-containing 2-like, partial [Brachionus plicatilis]